MVMCICELHRCKIHASSNQCLTLTITWLSNDPSLLVAKWCPSWLPNDLSLLDAKWSVPLRSLKCLAVDARICGPGDRVCHSSIIVSHKGPHLSLTAAGHIYFLCSFFYVNALHVLLFMTFDLLVSHFYQRLATTSTIVINHHSKWHHQSCAEPWLLQWIPTTFVPLQFQRNEGRNVLKIKLVSSVSFCSSVSAQSLDESWCLTFDFLAMARDHNGWVQNLHNCRPTAGFKTNFMFTSQLQSCPFCLTATKWSSVEKKLHVTSHHKTWRHFSKNSS